VKTGYLYYNCGSNKGIYLWLTIFTTVVVTCPPVPFHTETVAMLTVSVNN